MPYSHAPPPVDYGLPSWQLPFPAAPLAPVAIPRVHTHPLAAPVPSKGWAGGPYPPPYQPDHQSAIHIPNQKRKPVAIPRKQLGYITKPPRQYPGLPPDQAPKAQGLFQTLKPIRQGEVMSYEQFIMFNKERAKMSCRVAKRKCDEGKPMCSSCASTGKIECLYDSPPTGANRPASYGPIVSIHPQRTMHNPPNLTSVPPASDYQRPTMAPAPPQMQQVAGVMGIAGSTLQSYQTAPSTTPNYGLLNGSTRGYASTASSQAFGGGPHAQLGAHGREGSPDPWFPRR
ncbi:hypothetical protein LTR53_009556 [Teratosphaeriaceae sp. CCFEE 6253]|nr:hypothetical protein LTR53_009556 [Teratosphaeriaceae sp. CCFEE 6253]